MADKFARRLGRTLGRYGVSSGYVRVTAPRWADTTDESDVSATPTAVEAVLEVVATQRIKEEGAPFRISSAATSEFVAGLCNRLGGISDPPWRGTLDDAASVGFTLGMVEAHQSETAAGSSSPRFVAARQRLRRELLGDATSDELTATLYAFDCGYWLARQGTADVDSLLEAVPVDRDV